MKLIHICYYLLQRENRLSEIKPNIKGEMYNEETSTNGKI